MNKWNLADDNGNILWDNIPKSIVPQKNNMVSVKPCAVVLSFLDFAFCILHSVSVMKQDQKTKNRLCMTETDDFRGTTLLGMGRPCPLMPCNGGVPSAPMG